MNRRSFLKLLGLSFIAPKVAIEFLDKPPKAKGYLGVWDSVTIHETKARDINDITSKIWAKQWWNEAKTESFFYSRLNKKLLFNDKDYGVVSISPMKHRRNGIKHK